MANYVEVGPHTFRPLNRWRNRGRCEACHLHEDSHPVMLWTAARPLGNTDLPSNFPLYTEPSDDRSNLPEGMKLADLLAAEFALRSVLDDEEASDAVLTLRELDFVLIAPQYLAEKALIQERLRDA